MKTKLRLTDLAAILILLLSYQLNSQTTSTNDTIKKKKKTEAKIKISGLLMVHYLDEFNTNGDDVNDPSGFRIFRARLKAKGRISDKIHYELMVDPRSPEQGGVLRDAFIEFRHLKHHKIRLGRQKTQFGWENRQSSAELYTVNRAEMSDAVSRGENLRDNGIGLLGHIKINEQWWIEDAITFTNGARMDITGPYDFNSKKALWGRVGIKYHADDLTLNIGGSFGFGGLRYLGDDVLKVDDDVFADFKRFGTDVQVDHDRFFLACEFGQGKDMESDTIYNEVVGYQALLAIKTKWKAGPLVRYDQADDEWKVLTLGLYYGEPNDKLRFIVNYLFRGQITDVVNGHDDRLYLQSIINF